MRPRSARSYGGGPQSRQRRETARLHDGPTSRRRNVNPRSTWSIPLPLLLLFALTLFTSATLLFLVQPMIGKMLLPMLGGTPAVWNTCMVFFQALLLAGYLYSHITTALLGVRRQAVLHLGVLLLPFFSFLTLGLTVDRSLLD